MKLANYCPMRFTDNIANYIRSKEIFISPYLTFLNDSYKAEFTTNLVDSQYEMKEDIEYSWRPEEEADVFSVHYLFVSQ